MNLAWEFVCSPVAQRCSMMLLHFAWQGFCVAALVSVLLRMVRREDSDRRYAITLFGLLCMVVVPALTFVATETHTQNASQPILVAENWVVEDTIATVPQAPLDDLELESTVVAPAFQWKQLISESHWSYWQAILFCVWLFVELTLASRLAIGAILMWRIRRASSPVPASIHAAGERLARKLGIKIRPMLLASNDVMDALSYGFFRGVVILPASWLTQMKPEMIEAVLAHEFSHIRRCDAWVNLLQRILETVFFYHPAVWWLSNRIRIEREHSCDAEAVRLTGDAGLFAKTLEWAAQRRAAPQLAFVSSLGDDRMSLLNRVNRVLKNETVSRRSYPFGWPLGIAALLIPLLVAISGSKTESVAVEPPPAIPPSGQVLPSPYYQNDAPTPGLAPAAAPAPVSPTDVVSQKPTPASPAASELTKVSLPDYIVEPPDILNVRAVRLIAKDSFAIGPGDEFRISLGDSPSYEAGGGTYDVSAEGTLELGSPYGRVSVGGLSLIEAKKAIEKTISTKIKKPELTIQLAKIGYEGSIEGQRLVGPDGTISLGRYGRTYVAGKTLRQAKKAIEQLLTKYFKDPKVTVDIFVYNSKFYYVIIEKADPKAGDSVVRIPVTGNETVLDAMANIEGLTAISTKRVWVSRPGANGKLQTLDVDFSEITRGGSVATNYQMMPADRLFISDRKESPSVGKKAVGVSATVDDFNRLVRQRQYEDAIKCARSMVVTDKNKAIVESMNHHANLLEQSLVAIRNAQRQEVGEIIGDFRDAKLAEIATRRALRKKIKLKFDSVPLKSVVEHIASEMKLNVFLDSEQLAAEGVTPDVPISIELKQPVSARNALNLILEPLRLKTVILGNGVIKIQSEAVSSHDVYVETYYVDDLLGLPMTSMDADGRPKMTKLEIENLMSLIRATVSPNSWSEVGGPGALQFFKGNLSLVVSNSQEVHDEIKDLLGQLRKLTPKRQTVERIQKFPNEFQGEVRVGQSAELPPTRTSR